MQKQNSNTSYAHYLFYIGILVVIVFLFLFLQSNPDFLKGAVENYGLVGLFVGAIISNATILLPLPFDLLIAIIGANPQLIGFSGFYVFESIILALLVGFGAAIGEMTAYIIGLTGIKVAEKASKKQFRKLQMVREKLKKSGMVFIFLGALTPFPFDLIGIASGLIRYDIWKFFAAAFVGKTIRYFLILYAGFLGISFITNFFTG